MIDCKVIAQLLVDYDPDAHEVSIVKAEEQRADFVENCPKDGWPTMTLDRYALGQADHPENFCRWMEFVTSDLGSIRGGNARKHLIFFRAQAGEWSFDTNLYESVEAAWASVRQAFIDAIAFADSGEWASIDAIAALRWVRLSSTRPSPRTSRKTSSQSIRMTICATFFESSTSRAPTSRV